MFAKLFSTIALANLAARASAELLFQEIASTANDDQPNCMQQPFCDRFRSFMDHPELRAESDVYYSMDPASTMTHMSEGIFTGQLSLNSASDGTIAQTLDLTLTFYKDGILRMLVEEPDVKRFRISQEDLPVVDE